MTPEETALLKRVAEAAISYVAVVKHPPAAPAHKAQDAERRAFDALEEAVQAALCRKIAGDLVRACREAVASPTAADPEEEGAWS